MGGQACVLYGAAEFSRDLDLALLSDPDNLDRLASALRDHCRTFPDRRAIRIECSRLYVSSRRPA